MGLPYYFNQALSGVGEVIDARQKQKAKQAESEAALRNKLLGYQFLLNQQKQAQESAGRRDLERSKRDALFEAVKGGDESSARAYQNMLGIEAERPPAGFGQLLRESTADRANLPDVIAQGESSPAFVGPLESMARGVRAKSETEQARKQADLDLEREYKQQQMLESQSRIKENEANILKLRADTAKKSDKADIKDNISTLNVAIGAIGRERGVLSGERDKLLTVYKGRIPPEQMGRVNQIERRLAELDVEQQVKMRRLDSLREGFDVPPIKPGRLAGAHESYYLISQMIGRRALAPDLAKKLVQDGRTKSITEAHAKAKEYVQIRDLVKEYLKKPGIPGKPVYTEDDNLDELVDQFLSDNPDVTASQLR